MLSYLVSLIRKTCVSPFPLVTPPGFQANLIPEEEACMIGVGLLPSGV